MQLKGTPPTLVLSASDLSSFVGCRHRTALDLGVALGELPTPPYQPQAQDFIDRGLAHEAQYVASLASDGLTVADVRAEPDRLGATRDALTRGVDVVVQGMLAGDGWIGYPDVLRRVEVPSALGPWSYEVHDTKLARETRGSTILQLSVYSELLAAIEGRVPEHFHVVTPDPVNGTQTFRIDDYAPREDSARAVGRVGSESRPSPLRRVHTAIAR